MHTEQLFGEEIPGPSAMSEEELVRHHRRFDAREVEAVLEDVPTALMDGLIDAVRGYHAYHHETPGVEDMYGESVSDPNKGRLSAKGRLVENLAWVFDLYSEPPIVNFEWVCAEKEVDPEHLRAMLTRAFASEIRDLARAVFKLYPADAIRIQKRMRGYVDIDLTLH